ncbi:hypothetical protein Taro_009700 [Colocasia esculenta]|uniref:Uncharacterized protein n=1 Tax=Colocasia esculenta TaxID=4460 RepID=A0A843U6E8_COLES|nr:hypothetical protein [Colocasia esculenta]
MNEDQPHVAVEVDVPIDAPLSPQLQPSSSLNPETEIPSFSPQPPVHASSSFGGPSVPPELYTFLNDKFDALNTSIQTMLENFELRIQRLENTVSAKFIEQEAASDHATQRFNRLIGTLAYASVELKEHQEKLETVLMGILANSQADVFNTKETLSQISKTRLSFAHLVDDLESMKNLSAHIDEEMSALKREFKVLNRPSWSAGSSSSSQPVSTEFSALQATMDKHFLAKVDTRDLSQGIDLPVWDRVWESSYSLCGLSRRAQFGSLYSGCCLSHRAQFVVVVLQVFLESSCSRVFGVVVLQVFLESSCSRVFGVVMLLCELYSGFLSSVASLCEGWT